MADTVAEKGVTLEVLGQCMTNPTPGSQHDAKVEYRHLWSYAQQAALIAVSDKSEKDGCYHLILDPERRAKRIAAHYADLYFESAKKSKGQLQFYWPALAAFVVKDIVEAYRFSREDVLERQWNSGAGVARNNIGSDIFSQIESGNSPYEHVVRTYVALAKGNLWLFMDIHPWLWFFLEFGINHDGSLNHKRVASCLSERSWTTYQNASKKAIKELPFGRNWINRLNKQLASDSVYKDAGKYFSSPPYWTSGGGYGQHAGAALAAHHYCKLHAKDNDRGYRVPTGRYWSKFPEAYYIMDASHVELNRVCKDSEALAALEKCSVFPETAAVRRAYENMTRSFSITEKKKKAALQFEELLAIAEHELVNVLQPLIYDNAKLKETMDMNHKFSRLTSGWISPQFKVIYSFRPTNDDPSLQTAFDPPTGFINRFYNERKSLPEKEDRMAFVSQIGRDFHKLMLDRRPYMDAELRKIHGWINA